MEQTLANAGVSAGGLVVLTIVWKFGKSLLGKRITSDCCGRKMTAGISVSEMTPAKDPVLDLKEVIIPDAFPVTSPVPTPTAASRRAEAKEADEFV